MSVRERIERKLTEAFRPEALEVVDESEKHRGHGGWREGGETHFHVAMTSAAFAGEGRVQRQRAVNRVLGDELADRVHALGMTLKAPGE